MTISGPSPRVRRVSAGGRVTYHDETDTCSVYRVYDATDTLIYVGMSYDPDSRVRTHRREKSWRSEIARHESEWFPDRATAERAEAALIGATQPRHNVTHTPEHRVRSLWHLKRRADGTSFANMGEALGIDRSRASQIARGRTAGGTVAAGTEA